MLELTDYREMQEPLKIRTVLTCSIRLDKKTMLNALQSDAILINGRYYKVPENALLECLINRRFGEIRLDFEEIE